MHDTPIGLPAARTASNTAIASTTFRLQLALIATPQTKLEAYAAIEPELYVPLPLRRQGDDAH